MDGVKKVIAAKKKTFERKYKSSDVTTITDKEYESLYRLYDDPDFKALQKYLPSDVLMDLLVQSKELNHSYGQFVENISNYIDVTPDSDIKSNLQSLYKKLNNSGKANVYATITY